MNNKKSFQINNLNTSLTKFTNQLNILLEAKNALFDKIMASASTTSTSSITTSIHTHTDMVQPQNLENLTSLTTQQKQLEDNIKSIQLQIINQRVHYTETINNIKKLPEQLTHNIKNEMDIYNDELEAINAIHMESTQHYTDTINQSEIDKNALILKTQDIQNALDNKLSTITKLQIHEKLTRCQILQSLHKQKQDKHILQEHISRFTNTNILNIQQIDTLKELNKQLEQLKTHIINTHYLYVSQPDISYNSTTKLATIIEEDDESIDNHTLLASQPLEDNIQLNTVNMITEIIIFLSNNDIHISEGIDEPIDLYNPIYINLLVKQIDDYIEGNTNNINKILYHIDKEHHINIHTINELKKSFMPNTNTHTNTNTNTNTHSYTRIKNNAGRSKKLVYKIEKTDINNLKMRHTYLQHLYNNYDMLIIDDINNKYNTTLNELSNHKTRALERLNIINERLTNAFNINKENLQTQQLFIQTNIHKYNEDIELYTKQLQIIKGNIATINKSQIELNDIDIKITNITSTIEQLKNDLKFIENT